MKKAKIFLPLLAFLFAVVGAFAVQPKDAVVDYYRNTASPCPTQTECTLASGNPCDFTVYTTSACNVSIDRRKP